MNIPQRSWIVAGSGATSGMVIDDNSIGCNAGVVVNTKSWWETVSMWSSVQLGAAAHIVEGVYEIVSRIK